MADKKRGGGTVQAVWRLAEPIAEGLGFTLWDVRYEKEGAQWFLRIFIDKPGGVDMDDCVAMSHAVDGPLDELDPIDGAYCMEVCSPGLGRELTRPEHFAACIGSRVRVRLIRPLEDGRRELTAELLACADGVLTLADGEKKTELARGALSWARLADDDFMGGFEEE